MMSILPRLRRLVARRALGTIASLLCAVAPQQREALGQIRGNPLRPASPASVEAKHGAGQVNGATSLTSQQIQTASAVLLDLNPDVDASTRIAAAASLWHSPEIEAVDPLAEALRSGRAEVMLPVLHLIAAAATPRREFLQPLIDAMVEGAGTAEQALHAALATYGESAVSAAARIAASTSTPVEHRIRAIRCMGAFRLPGPTCAEHLLGLLDPARKESLPIIDAACDSLGSITGMVWGRDAVAWRDWWTTARNLAPEAWAPDAVRSLSARLTDLQARHDLLARRYVNALRDLFVRLPLDQQLAALQPLLEDDTLLVREFALDRVGRLLRDSERVPPEIQSLLVRRLDVEPSGRLRLQTATLLNQLNDDSLSAWLGRTIESETRPAIAGGLLQLIADRHESVSISVITRWLPDDTAGEPTAAAAWFMMRDGKVHTDELAMLRAGVTEVFDRRKGPMVVRLMALVCDDARLPQVEALLDDPAESVRRAAAEGLRARGRTEPLVARAADPVIFAQAVESLVEGEPTLNSFTALAQLEPVQPESRQLWSGALVRLAHRLPVATLLAADNVLMARGVELPVRAQAIAQAVAGSPNAPEPLPTALVARIAEIRLTQDDANGALQVLSLPSATDDPTLTDLRFDSLLMLARYDEAEQVYHDPAAWLAAMDRVTHRRPDLIGAVRTEILSRFHESLTEDQRTALRQSSAEGRGAAADGTSSMGLPG
jgi:hypothetical protein